MKRILLSITTLVIAVCAMAQSPAFPGAEGHGRYATGGRGGVIRHVTNLSGEDIEGSFRRAIGYSNSIVVFDVAGVIELKADVSFKDNITVLGQTAPAPGITLRYRTIRPGNNNVIRFIRIRRGEEKDVNDGADATWQTNVKNLVFDHCSFSWSIDEIASFYDNQNFTMQWCTLGEALANPGHTKGEHSYGGIWGGKNASFHHNFIAHVQNRAPRFCGARYASNNYDKTKYTNPIQAENVDFRNCVMYNWGSGNGCYGGTGGGQINIVNNYYKAGPATVNKTRTTQISVATSSNASGSPYMGYCSRYYINGNYVTAAGNDAANYDWKGVIYDNGTYDINGEKYCQDADHLYGDGVTYVKNSSNVDCVKIKMDSPVATGEVTTHSAEKAYEKVLSYVGASLFRDNVDKRYVREAQNGITTFTGSAQKTGDGKDVIHYPGIIDFVKDQGEYTLASNKRPSLFDADNDGMADEWEQANGGDLEPNAYTIDSDKKWYTNLEVYANSIVEDIMKEENKDALTAVDEYYPACTKVDVNPADNPDSGIAGSITWPFDLGTENQTAEILTSIQNGISSTSVSKGSDLDFDGKQKINNGPTETKIKDLAMASTTPSDNNALTFTINIANGYKFLATDASVTATRMGTDAGSIDISWKDASGTNKLKSGEKPNRDNGTPPFSTYSCSLEDIATETEGSCSLIINVYGVTTGYKKDGSGNPTTEINYKDYGFCNISISGMLISPTGISTPVSFKAPLSNTYYNLKGQRVASPTKGLYIVNGKKVIIK